MMSLARRLNGWRILLVHSGLANSFTNGVYTSRPNTAYSSTLSSHTSMTSRRDKVWKVVSLLSLLLHDLLIHRSNGK